MSQFRCRHLEFLNDHRRRDTRSLTYGFGIRQCVASLSASLILRQLIRCARFGTDVWNGYSVADHLEERESSSIRRRHPVTYARVSPSSNERISIVFELFRSTQIQLQIDRQLNDRQQIISTVDTRVKHRMCRGGRCNGSRRRRCRSDVLHHFVRITDDQNDERIVLSSEQHVHLLEEAEKQCFHQSKIYIKDLNDSLLFTNIQSIDQDHQTSVGIQEGFHGFDDVRQLTDFFPQSIE